MTLLERFWIKVDQRGDDECWPWIAGKNSSGYGSFWDGTRSVCAHRFISSIIGLMGVLHGRD